MKVEYPFQDNLAQLGIFFFVGVDNSISFVTFAFHLVANTAKCQLFEIADV